jgi:coenzyme PQQ precursor peptide PqqA
VFDAAGVRLRRVPFSSVRAIGVGDRRSGRSVARLTARMRAGLSGDARAGRRSRRTVYCVRRVASLRSLPTTAASKGRPGEEMTMAWTTPTLVEICVGLEINGYLPAEF